MCLFQNKVINVSNMPDSYLRSSFHRSGESPQWRKNERCAIMHICNRRRLCKNGVPFFFKLVNNRLFFSQPFSTNLSSKTAGLSNWVYPFSQNNDWRRKFTFLLGSQIAKKVSHMTIQTFVLNGDCLKTFGRITMAQIESVSCTRWFY